MAVSDRRLVYILIPVLPAMQVLRAQPAETRHLLADLLAELADDARLRAETCWRFRKAPIGACW